MTENCLCYTCICFTYKGCPYSGSNAWLRHGVHHGPLHRADVQGRDDDAPLAVLPRGDVQTSQSQLRRPPACRRGDDSVTLRATSRRAVQFERYSSRDPWYARRRVRCRGASSKRVVEGKWRVLCDCTVVSESIFGLNTDKRRSTLQYAPPPAPEPTLGEQQKFTAAGSLWRDESGERQSQGG